MTARRLRRQVRLLVTTVSSSGPSDSSCGSSPVSSVSAAPAEPAATSRPASALPTSQALRQAMSAEEGTGAPPPFPAAGLPRDRDELLAMIRQAIRDELAGPLGERISINIRHLVAREVKRAVEEMETEKSKGPGAG